MWIWLCLLEELIKIENLCLKAEWENMQYGSYQCLWLFENFQEYSFCVSAVTYSLPVFSMGKIPNVI